LGAGGIKLGTPDGAAATPADVPNIEAIGRLLYSKYLFLFEAAGIILLVAMVGAIVLTHRRRPGLRGQSVARQIARRPDEATVNMQPEVGKGVRL
jgi:NADH-quinone oxidoreductase subunit J